VLQVFHFEPSVARLPVGIPASPSPLAHDATGIA
jgi:hypothetical protein